MSNIQKHISLQYYISFTFVTEIYSCVFNSDMKRWGCGTEEKCLDDSRFSSLRAAKAVSGLGVVVESTSPIRFICFLEARGAIDHCPVFGLNNKGRLCSPAAIDQNPL